MKKTQNTQTTPRITPEWYRSSNVRPKTFTARFVRNNDGTYQLVRANVIHRVNQHKTSAARVDARDFARDLNRSVVVAA